MGHVQTGCRLLTSDPGGHREGQETQMGAARRVRRCHECPGIGHRVWLQDGCGHRGTELDESVAFGLAHQAAVFQVARLRVLDRGQHRLLPLGQSVDHLHEQAWPFTAPTRDQGGDHQGDDGADEGGHDAPQEELVVRGECLVQDQDRPGDTERRRDVVAAEVPEGDCRDDGDEDGDGHAVTGREAQRGGHQDHRGKVAQQAGCGAYDRERPLRLDHEDHGQRDPEGMPEGHQKRDRLGHDDRHGHADAVTEVGRTRHQATPLAPWMVRRCVGGRLSDSITRVLQLGDAGVQGLH